MFESDKPKGNQKQDPAQVFLWKSKTASLDLKFFRITGTYNFYKRVASTARLALTFRLNEQVIFLIS